MKRKVTDREYIEDRISQSPDGCWLWMGHIEKGGYGMFIRGTGTSGTKRQLRAHRVSYELFVGPIPEGHEIHHLCEIPRCVNPEHLEVVTHAANMAALPRKVYCPLGHKYTLDNTYWFPNGRSYRCRECHRQKNREYMRTKRAELKT